MNTKLILAAYRKEMSNDELLNSLQQMIDVAEKRMAEHSLESRHAWDLTYRSYAARISDFIEVHYG